MSPPATSHGGRTRSTSAIRRTPRSADSPANRSSRVTTVFVRQGHYAHDPEVFKKYPPADISLERIGDLLNYGADSFSAQALVTEPRA